MSGDDIDQVGCMIESCVSGRVCIFHSLAHALALAGARALWCALLLSLMYVVCVRVWVRVWSWVWVWGCVQWHPLEDADGDTITDNGSPASIRISANYLGGKGGGGSPDGASLWKAKDGSYVC